MIKINFICRGNVWRSRVAEAYARSLLADHPDIEVSSSGIEASRNYDGPISRYAKIRLEQDNILQYAHPEWTQTTQQTINDFDLLIFMNDTVYGDARKLFKIPSDKSIIWHIPDRDEIYDDIKTNVRKLLESKLIRI
jgi:protein-tyrosine-phosphatase